MGRTQIILFRELVTYSAEAIALFAQMDVQPDDTRKALINTMIVDLKAAGVWTLLDTFYVLAAHDEQASLLNWVAPSTFELTKVNAPVFIIDRGFSGDGTTKYLTTGYNFVTDSVNYTLNNASQGVYVNQAVGYSLISAGTYSAGALNYMAVKHSSYLGYDLSINSLSDITGVSDGLGLTVIDRQSSTNVKVFRNGMLDFTSTTNNSSALTNLEDYILTCNFFGASSFGSNQQIAVRYVGASLDDTKQAELSNIIETFLTAIGGEA